MLYRKRFAGREIMRVMLIFAIASAVGIAITGGWWMWHLWVLFGDPFFPMFNNIFHSPFAEVDRYSDSRIGPKGLWEWIAFPFFLAVAPKGLVNYFQFDFRYAVVFLLYGAAACFALIRRREQSFSQRKGLIGADIAAFVLTVTVASYYLWEATFGAVRYLLPLDALLPLAALILLFSMRLKTSVATLSWSALFVACAIILPPPWHGDRAWRQDLLTAQIPPLPHPDKSMVVLPGPDPLAFLIPSFDKRVRFVRISNANGFDDGEVGSVTSVKSSAVLARKARESITSFRGDLFVLYRVRPDALDAPVRQARMDALSRVGMAVDEGVCQRIQVPAALTGSDIMLCPLIRSSRLRGDDVSLLP
jgi:hypothetical protein